MKKTRKLIPAIAMLLMSTVMMSTASFAWFSMNTETNVSGMQVQATAGGSLIISDQLTTLSAAKISHAFTETDIKLSPVTYDETENDTGYKIPNSFSDIKPETGLPESGTVTLADIASGDGYYKDYVVYIAAAGAAMEATKINAEVTFLDINDNAVELEQCAATVAFTYFFDQKATIATELTTDLAPNGKAVAATAKLSSNKTTVEYTHSETFDVPLNDNKSSIAVVMRVYFDGALEESAGKTWVRSQAVSAEDIKISVKFTIPDAAIPANS